MKKLSLDLKFLFILFLSWRLLLFLILFIAVSLVPLYGKDLLGGGLVNYIANPWIFAWSNFDGEHYLSIAKDGYQDLTHSFFPLYPLLIKFVSNGSKNIDLLVFLGLVISNLFFLLSLLTFRKLLNLDFDKKITIMSLLCLAIFPTSFYFAAFYTESLFLFLVLESFYFARKQNWLLASIIAGLSSATRVVGVLMLPALAVEWFLQFNKLKSSPQKWFSLISLLFIPLGVLIYMFYLKQVTGDPLAFLHELYAFGLQRGGGFTLLPQVFYRYITIFATVNPNDYLYKVALLEFIVAVGSLVLLVVGYFQKIRLSYLVFGLLAYLLPSSTGSFSSLPRYILIAFPIYITLGLFLTSKNKFIKTIYFGINTLLLCIMSALFLRGYWIS